MKPNRTIIVNIHDYENMSVKELNALINELCSLNREKLLTVRANEYTEKLKTLICDIMDNDCVVYFHGKPIEPEDLEVRID